MNGDITRLLIIGALIFFGIPILQTVFRSLGKILRWAVSTGLMLAVVFLLWKGGAFEWLDAQMSALPIGQ